MTNFQKGQKVKIRCLIGPGPTPSEFLITVEGTKQGKISGFVRDVFLERSAPGIDSGYVLAEIIGVAPDEVTVQIPGSFFTTAIGLTSLPKATAERSLALV